MPLQQFLLWLHPLAWVVQHLADLILWKEEDYIFYSHPNRIASELLQRGCRSNSRWPSGLRKLCCLDVACGSQLFFRISIRLPQPPAMDSTPSKRRRMSKKMPLQSSDKTSEAQAGVGVPQATDHDRLSWHGWSEIESEPVRKRSHRKLVRPLIYQQAIFNVMLRRCGAHGVKVEEIVSLEDEILQCLP